MLIPGGQPGGVGGSWAQLELTDEEQETIKGTERASPIYTLFHR